MRVSSRRVDALERAPPDALAGPSLPGGGPNHAFLSRMKGTDLSFGQSPPWLHVQAVPKGASARPQSEGRCVGAGAPKRSRRSFFARRRAQTCSTLSAEVEGPVFLAGPTLAACASVASRCECASAVGGCMRWCRRPGRSRWSFFAWRRAQPCCLISDKGQGPVYRAGPNLAACASVASRCG